MMIPRCGSVIGSATARRGSSAGGDGSIGLLSSRPVLYRLSLRSGPRHRGGAACMSTTASSRSHRRIKRSRPTKIDEEPPPRLSPPSSSFAANDGGVAQGSARYASEGRGYPGAGMGGRGRVSRREQEAAAASSRDGSGRVLSTSSSSSSSWEQGRPLASESWPSAKGRASMLSSASAAARPPALSRSPAASAFKPWDRGSSSPSSGAWPSSSSPRRPFPSSSSSSGRRRPLTSRKEAVAVKKAAWLSRRLQRPLPRGAMYPVMDEVERHRDGSITRWIVDKKLVAQAEIRPSPHDKVTLPANLPKAALEGGLLKPLLPAGLSEGGLLVASRSVGLARQMKLPRHYNPSTPGRPDSVNDLLTVLLKAPEPEARMKAAEQLRWVRTKLSNVEALAVLDQTMEHFGWKAGLRYLERMGEAQHCQLKLRHFNRVIEHCCIEDEEGRDSHHRQGKPQGKDDDKEEGGGALGGSSNDCGNKSRVGRGRGARLGRVVDAMVGQGLSPSLRTVYLMLEAAARDGDYRTAEDSIRLARAYGLQADARSLEKVAVAYARGGEVGRAGEVLVAMARGGKWPTTGTRGEQQQQQGSGGGGDGGGVVSEVVRAHAKQGVKPEAWVGRVEEGRWREEVYREAVKAFAQEGRPHDAHVLLMEMIADRPPLHGGSRKREEASSCDADLYRALASSYMAKGQPEEAVKVFRQSQEEAAASGDNASSSSYHQSVMIRGCLQHGRPDLAASLVHDMDRQQQQGAAGGGLERHHPQQHRRGGSSSWPRQPPSSLLLEAHAIRALVEAGQWAQGVDRFRRLPQPTTMAMNAALQGCIKAGAAGGLLGGACGSDSHHRDDHHLRQHPKEGEAQAVLEMMVGLLRHAATKGVLPDGVSYNLLVKACGRARHWPVALYLGDEFFFMTTTTTTQHQHYPVSGGGGGSGAGLAPASSSSIRYVMATLISVLGKAGLWGEALELLGRVEERDLVCYNSALDALAVAGQWRRARELLHRMGQEGVAPDIVSYTAVMAACANHPQQQHHRRSMESEASPSDGGGGVAVSREAAEVCLALLRDMEEHHLLQRQQEQQVGGDGGDTGHQGATQEDRPPAPAVASSAAAGAAVGGNGGGEQVVVVRGTRVPPPPPRPTLHAYTCAIDACGKAGLFDQALTIFRSSLPRAGLQPTAVTYNAMVAACAYVGKWDHALALLREMRAAAAAASPGLRPDHVTYGAATFACGNSDVKGGGAMALRLLGEMKAEGLRPSLLNYKHVLYALARDSMGLEAVEVMEEMMMLSVKQQQQQQETASRGAAVAVVPDGQCWTMVRRACRASPEAWRACQRLKARQPSSAV